MIVLDASVVVELLAGGPLADSIRRRLAARDEVLIAPHLLDVEVVSALRRLTQGRRTEAASMRRLLLDLAELPAERYPHQPLLGRMWELRHQFTACDAAYIALAEIAGATLYTCDSKLRLGHRAKVVVLSAAG
jgi:predicted nucleic acid-binding protein